MKFKLVELTDLSGPKTVIYSVCVDDDEESLFERFIRENLKQYTDEANDIIALIEDMGYKYGARWDFFEHYEGVPGDGVCALYDDPDKKLRLYCIRYASTTIILGGGGHKPKKIRAYQEVPKLNQEASIIKAVSQKIIQAQRDGDLHWDGPFLEGEIIFDEED